MLSLTLATAEDAERLREHEAVKNKWFNGPGMEKATITLRVLVPEEYVGLLPADLEWVGETAEFVQHTSVKPGTSHTPCIIILHTGPVLSVESVEREAKRCYGGEWGDYDSPTGRWLAVVTTGAKA